MSPYITPKVHVSLQADINLQFFGGISRLIVITPAFVNHIGHVWMDWKSGRKIFEGIKIKLENNL